MIHYQWTPYHRFEGPTRFLLGELAPDWIAFAAGPDPWRVMGFAGEASTRTVLADARHLSPELAKFARGRRTTLAGVRRFHDANRLCCYGVQRNPDGICMAGAAFWSLASERPNHFATFIAACFQCFEARPSWFRGVDSIHDRPGGYEPPMLIMRVRHDR